MNKLQVPIEITDFITNFCKSISKIDPLYVDVLPDDGALVNECFPNVERKILRDYGEMIYGWQIWIWPEIFIEAEFHGVWKAQDGHIVDVTPKIPPMEKILFLPDEYRKYEGFQIDNRRKKISDNGVLDDYFFCNEALYAMKNYGDRKFRKELILKNEESQIFQFLVSAIYNLELFIAEKNNRNSPCFCHRNEKYKRCCGETIRRMIVDLKEQYNF